LFAIPRANSHFESASRSPAQLQLTLQEIRLVPCPPQLRRVLNTARFYFRLSTDAPDTLRFTLGLIQCQFRTAHEGGQNCSFHAVEYAARV